jgi:ADP-heptose:LPS heptosyltransferase
MKILVIQQKMIGDVLVSSILCNNLRKMYPNATIDYMIYEHTLAVVYNNPNIDNLLLITEKDKKLGRLIQRIRQLRKSRYDIVIDAYCKLGTSIMCLFSGAAITIGFRKWYTSFCYRYTWKRKDKPTTVAGLAIEHRQALLDFLKPSVTMDLMPRIFLTEDELAMAKATLQEHQLDGQPLIMIGLLGSDKRKSYPAAYMAQVLDIVAANTQARLLVNYMPSQQAEATAILALCKADTVEKIVTALQPKGLRSFLAILYYCKAIIGNEGGAVNMAKALGLPTFSIFSPMVAKEGWDLFADGNKHVSVHVNDFTDEPLVKLNKKQAKEQVFERYHQFTPAMIEPKLLHFIAVNTL